MSNKNALLIVTVCSLIVLAVFTFIKVDSARYLSDKQITKTLKKHIGVIPLNVESNNGTYICDIWEGDYAKFMTGLRNSFYELSKKENTGYELIVVNLNDAKLPEGNQLVNGYALYVDDLYSIDWKTVTSFDEFKKICNIE